METRPTDAQRTTPGVALEESRAFVELATWRVVAVLGSDARRWLHDLVTANVEGLRPGEARRSLLLTPTGRIRADLHVVADDGSFLLLQSPDQAEPVDAILSPYVLSSDVQVEDRTDLLVPFAVLGGGAAEDGEHGHVSSPSALGPGHDVVVPSSDAALLRERLLGRGLVEADAEAIEVWRIRRGLPRMGADFGPDSLPAEAGLEDVIDFTKGCFLGQESVAKVRNLGRPPRRLVAVRSRAAIAPGDTVFAAGAAVGQITSAAAAVEGDDDGTDGIARVRWDAADTELTTGGGPLVVRHIR